MTRYLIVANQTAAGAALRETVSQLVSQGPCSFLLVVPATHPRDHATWTEGTAFGLARRRLEEAVDVLRSAGAQVTGWVGDENPFQAICDAMDQHPIDEIVLSTFPAGISRGLGMDLESRVRARFDKPLRVVTSDRVPVRS